MKSVEFFSANLETYVAELRELVAWETPTGDVPRLNGAAEHIAGLFAGLGRCERIDLEGHGPLLHVVREGEGPRVVFLAHYDTVWPVGSWVNIWWRQGGRAFGPGAYDMKGGLLFLVWLLRFLEADGAVHPTIEVLINPDEEMGSPGSRQTIEAVARRSDFALVLEPANLAGNLKLARKGSGEFVITCEGRSAHQGVEPEAGVNAVVEAAHQVLRLLDLADHDLGTTVGPNVISGGHASNSVPDRAVLKVDVRAWEASEGARLERAIRALEPIIEGSRITVTGSWNRPPMATSPGSLVLFERARAVGSMLGLDLEWVRWGGSSDANLTAAVGTPTVDGLGPIGEGAHQLNESIVIDAVPVSLALLTELVTSLVHPPAVNRR